jgi:hypothetical protein
VAIRDGRSEMSEIDDKWREIPGDQHIGWSRDAPQLTVGPGLTPANGIGPGWLEAGAQMLARGLLARVFISEGEPIVRASTSTGSRG